MIYTNVSKKYKKLSFKVRSFLDSYDGYVARSRTHQRGMAQVWGSWGYYLVIPFLKDIDIERDCDFNSLRKCVAKLYFSHPILASCLFSNQLLLRNVYLYFHSNILSQILLFWLLCRLKWKIFMLEVINFIQDGICDLFGTSFFMFVVLLIMKRKNLPRKIIRYQSSSHKSIFNLK